MTRQYVEIKPEKTRADCAPLTNGDIIHAGGEGTVFAGQWFFYHKTSKYTHRLPKSNNLQEALEEYQQETGNCIINVDDYKGDK
jgi:hypothetical protein